MIRAANDNDDLAARLYERANQAALDAVRYEREDGGASLACQRRRDARTLRALARARLRA